MKEPILNTLIVGAILGAIFGAIVDSLIIRPLSSTELGEFLGRNPLIVGVLIAPLFLTAIGVFKQFFKEIKSGRTKGAVPPPTGPATP